MNPLPESPVLLVYLDRYHLGDPLFLQRFAPVVKAHEGPLVLVHGVGEAAERALEAGGRVVEHAAGVLRVADEGERALVERAGRDLNRQVVHALNEAGVAALRLLGVDRGLLRQTPEGGVAAGRVGWLLPLLRQGAVPVLAALAADADGRAVEVAVGDALAALAQALHAAVPGAAAPVAVLFPRPAGRREGAGAEPALPEPAVARRVAGAGVSVRVAPPAALRGAGLPTGTDLGAAGS
jgi:isopentenyl phosphate kinase